MLGLNSYVSDDDKSIKSCLKFIRPSGVPLLPLFATIGATATAERKIIEILIHDYNTLLGANSYVFDDNKSIESGFNYPVCHFYHFFGHCGAQNYQNLMALSSSHYSYDGPIMLSGSQRALSGFQSTIAGSQKAISEYQVLIVPYQAHR